VCVCWGGPRYTVLYFLQAVHSSGLYGTFPLCDIVDHKRDALHRPKLDHQHSLDSPLLLYVLFTEGIMYFIHRSYIKKITAKNIKVTHREKITLCWTTSPMRWTWAKTLHKPSVKINNFVGWVEEGGNKGLFNSYWVGSFRKPKYFMLVGTWTVWNRITIQSKPRGKRLLVIFGTW
jgi:hypothetical protein